MTKASTKQVSQMRMGTVNGRCTLHPRKIEEMRRLRTLGNTIRFIARRLRCSESNVSRVLAGKIRKHG